MPALLEDVHTSLAELSSKVNEIKDPEQQEGLKAFIEVITPHLMEEVTFSIVGKIAQAAIKEPINATNINELLEKLGEDYEVTVE
jgi:hypothetical protein